MRSAHYRTRQGQRILEYFASLGDRHVTAGEIVQHFSSQSPAIGQTTVYRHLEKLGKSGLLRRYALGGESACYQFAEDSTACQEHFHLKCEQCGGLIHLDCSLLDEMYRHVLGRHHFRINALKTVLYGTCGQCLNGTR